MKKQKKSFLLHIDSLDILDDLTNEQAGELFKAIKSFQKHEEIKLNSIVKIAFSPFKNQFIRDDEKYKKTCESRAIAGSKGGKQKVANASKCKQKIANVADNKNKTKNDNDNEILDRAFEFIWNDYPSSRRKNKKGCLTKFKAKCKNLTNDQVEDLTNKIVEDIHERITQLENIKYMPMTETYLNQERWLDNE